MTPGPWKADGRLVINGSGDAVAMVNLARAEHAAHCDARLIAAAPRMFDRIAKFAADGDVESIAIMEAVNGRA